jgi:transposase InsO family protein
LSCVSSTQADIIPSATRFTRTQFAKDPGGSSVDPWEDANLLRCLRGTPVHQVSSDVTEQQRTAGRLSAYALDVKDDNVERLYRNVLDGSHREVPPPANRLILARQIHTKRMHLGVRRTQQQAMRQWYWYKLSVTQMRITLSLIAHTTISMEMCTTASGHQTSGEHMHRMRPADDPELHSLPIKELGYRWSTDMLKLPVSDRGFCRCMVCVEHLSRFIIVIPLQAKSAYDAALAFKLHVIGVFGLMEEVVTDQGTEFAADYHDMLDELGIDHRQTSPYCPQGNGLSERIVQMVKKAMNKKVAEINGHGHWKMFAPMIALAYNARVQESTKLSPSTVMMAQLPIVPPQEKRLFNDTLVIGETTGDQVIAGADLLRQAEQVKKAGIYALSGLQAAQHRDTKRYATTHSGNYA